MRLYEIFLNERNTHKKKLKRTIKISRTNSREARRSKGIVDERNDQSRLN
jgi:hypothetical protein